MKISTDGIDRRRLDQRAGSRDTAGQPYEKITDLKGVEQLDTLRQGQCPGDRSRTPSRRSEPRNRPPAVSARIVPNLTLTLAGYFDRRLAWLGLTALVRTDARPFNPPLGGRPWRPDDLRPWPSSASRPICLEDPPGEEPDWTED